MIYLVILLALIFFSYRYDYRKATVGKGFCTLCVVMAFILVAGLRYRLGVDSIRYESYYAKVPEIWNLKYSYFMKTRFEPGFVILWSLCKSVSSDFTFFQLVHATILNLTVWWFFRKNTPHIFFAFFLYAIILYVFLNYEVLREALAIVCFLFAWDYLKRFNFLMYYVLAALAVTFHIGACVTLLCPLFFIPGINWFFTFGKRTIFICAAIIGIVFAISHFFFSFAQLLTFSATAVDRATAYSKNVLGGTMVNVLGALAVLIRWVGYPSLALYCLYRRKREGVAEQRNFKVLEALTLMSVYISCCSIPMQLFLRFNNYFLWFSIVCMSRLAFSTLPIKGKKYRLSFLYWMVVFFPLMFLQGKGQFQEIGFSGKFKQYMVYYPYSSRLDPQEDRAREALFLYHRAW